MTNIRIIPRLDIKGPNLVKGIHLEGVRVLGKPFRFAKHYYEGGADELIYMDAVASLYGRNSLLDFVTLTAQEIFIPLTVGGGLRTLDDIHSVLRAGADKVAINTAAIKNPDFIRQAVQMYGSSTIIVSIEAKKHPDGTYEAYIDNGREKTGIDAFSWARESEALGAGEIMITSIDQEGTGKGFDNTLVEKIASSVSIPVIACGGAGNNAHIHDVVVTGKANAVAVASVLHYRFIGEFDVLNDLTEEDNSAFLKKSWSFSRIEPASIEEIKKSFLSKHIQCRPISGSA